MTQLIGFIQDEAGAELALVVYNVLGQAIADENAGTGASVEAAASKTFPFE
jgi:hypothetical protein